MRPAEAMPTSTSLAIAISRTQPCAPHPCSAYFGLREEVNYAMESATLEKTVAEEPEAQRKGFRAWLRKAVKFRKTWIFLAL